LGAAVFDALGKVVGGVFETGPVGAAGGNAAIEIAAAFVRGYA